MFHNHYSLLQNVLSGGFTLGGSIPSITSLYGHMINAIQSRDSQECEVTNEGWSIGCVGMSSQASCLFQQPPLDELPGKPGKPIALDSLDWFLLELLLALKCESQTWRHSLLMISFVAQPIVATHTFTRFKKSRGEVFPASLALCLASTPQLLALYIQSDHRTAIT